MSESTAERFLLRMYKVRWLVTAVLVLGVVGTFVGGVTRVANFTSEVDSLADHPPEKSPPRMFDPRTDIWFDAGDPALQAWRDLETKYIGEDPVLIAFEAPDAPGGVFSVESLQTIERLTQKIKQVPYVRTVRSLTANPWIRWGAVSEDEDGLIVSDLFETDPSKLTERERYERMIAVMGAHNAAGLIGEDKVREILGPDANFDDHIGEPRLLENVLSADGRATALVVQLVRPRLPGERLDDAFGAGTVSRAAGPAIHGSVVQTEALHAIQDIVAEEKAYEFHITGIPVMQEHFQVIAQGDMSFVGMMILVIAIVLLIVYRRAAGMALPLFTVILGILGMMGTILLKGDLINGLTAMTPHMLIAIGIANAVHLVTAYYRLRPHYTDRHELVRETVRFNALPVFLTSATTAIGFLSLMTSGILPIRSFGYTAALGTLFAYLLSMTLVPSVLSLLKLPATDPDKAAKAEVASEKNHWSEPLAVFVFRNRLAIIVVGVVLTGMAVFGLTRVNLTSDMRLMFGDSDPVVADVLWLDEHIGGSGDLEVVFDGADSPDTTSAAAERQARIEELGAADSPEEKAELARLNAAEAEYQRGRIADSAAFLVTLDRFQKRLEQEADDPTSPLRVLTSFDSALGVLRKIHQVQNENRGTFYRVPTEDDVPEDARKPTVIYDEVMDEETIIPAQNASTMISQYYLQFENGAKPEDNLTTFITPDRRSFRVTMRTRAAASRDTLAAYARLRHIAATEFPELVATRAEVNAGKAIASMSMTGNYYMQMNMITAFSETLIVSLSLALLVITVLITLVFRSITVGLVSMIPNVLPIIVPLGALAAIGVPLDGPAILVAAVGLGICVDDTIHFLTKYTRARGLGYEIPDAIRATFREVGLALTYTSIILVCGFSVMTMATFRPNAMIGFLGAAMIALAWAADFLLTPAVLSYLPAKGGHAAKVGHLGEETSND